MSDAGASNATRVNPLEGAMKCDLRGCPASIVWTEPAWRIAFHRFAEVSVGIAVALVMTVVWPERGAKLKPQQSKYSLRKLAIRIWAASRVHLRKTDNNCSFNARIFQNPNSGRIFAAALIQSLPIEI